MLKRFFHVFKRIANWKVVCGYMILFSIILLCPFRFVPDLFNLGGLVQKKEIVFKLLTTILGFSGIILTILLVVYNFYFKSIRRNTLDFIIDNKWLQLIFSLFFGSILFLSAGFFLTEVNSSFNDLTLLYFSYAITLIFIILLLPISFLSLSDSVSLQRVNSLIAAVSEDDIGELNNPEVYGSSRHIEKNPLLILKDIGINAISDKDWVLPQTILTSLFNLLIQPLDSKASNGRIQFNIGAWTLICHHFKREIVNKEDTVTGHVLLAYNLEAHRLFAERKVLSIRGNSIDDFLADYYRIIIEKNLFFELQTRIISNLANIVKHHFKALNYTDEQIPVGEYYYQQSVKNLNFSLPRDSRTNYWYYITHELPNNLFSIIKYAIDAKREHVYEHFSWQIHYLIAQLCSENLTKSQQEEAVKQIMFKANQSVEYAISKGINEGIDVISHIQIETWFKNKSRLGFEGLFTFGRMIKLLHKNMITSSRYVDDFFLIARTLSNTDIPKSIKQEIVKYIIDTSLKIVEEPEVSKYEKDVFLNQLYWLYNSYLKEVNDLAEVNEFYSPKLDILLNGFNMWSRYD